MANSDTPGLFAWAMEYARRGWSLVALHHVEDVGAFVRVCSCGNRDERHRSQAGKHPRNRGWAEGNLDHPGRWQRGERHNIGIKTGKASGFWVLDFDPDGVGDDDGHALLQRLADEGYAPHVRTGGGGYHWRFTLPSDFEVRNRQSAGGGGGRTHALPMGWDVRGEGGQVVAPPSVTAKGAYVELIEGDDVREPGPYAPPAWLLEMIRPQATPVRDDPPDHMVSPATAYQGAPGGASVVGGGTGEGSSRPADQVQAYCTAALYAEVEEYGALQDGRRGEAAAAFARTLVELANTAGWPHDAVYRHFEAAMERAAGNAGGGGYAPHEVPNQWARAVEHVGARVREIPPRVDALPPFPTAGPGLASDGATLNFVDPGTGGASTYGANGAGTGSTTVGVMPAPNGVPPVMDPWQQRVEEKARKLLQDQQARDLVQRWSRAGQPPLASEVIYGDGLDSIADPTPLIDGVLFLDSLARINGRPAQGKSFVAVDMACSVATGANWHGHAVRAGAVLYLAAEGLSGLKLRIKAWESDRGTKVGRSLALFPRAVQVIGPEWPELVVFAASLRPALVVIDTQAQVTGGVNENDAGAQGEVVVALQAMRAATGATVLLIHHAGKTGDGESGRGINTIEGAVTSEFAATKAGPVVTIKTTKQKDIPAPDPIKLTLKTVDESAVFAMGEGFIDPSRAPDMTLERARALYNIMLRHFDAEGGTRADIDKQLKADPSMAGLNMGSGQNGSKAVLAAWRELIIRGLVIKMASASRFKVITMERTGADGVLTPNGGEYFVAEPAGWATWCPEAASLAKEKVPVPKVE